MKLAPYHVVMWVVELSAIDDRTHHTYKKELHVLIAGLKDTYMSTSSFADQGRTILFSTNSMASIWCRDHKEFDSSKAAEKAIRQGATQSRSGRNL